MAGRLEDAGKLGLWKAGGRSLDRRLPQSRPALILALFPPWWHHLQNLLFGRIRPAPPSGFHPPFPVVLLSLPVTMQLWHTLLRLGLLASAAVPTGAASTWGFTDATVSVHTKGAGVGSGSKEE